MSGVGLDWYKREHAAYLKDVQGLTAREHAVYSVVLDLIYAHGGSVNNDPKFLAGWFSDMGAASVRNTISSLVARGILAIDGDQITQKRARSQARVREKFTENSVKTEKKRDVFPEFSAPPVNENKELAGQRREEKITPLAPQGGTRKFRSIGVSEEVARLARAMK